MIYLILSILCSSAIILSFKFFEQKKMKIFPLVVLNYYSATAAGLILNKVPFSFSEVCAAKWFVPAIGLGILLVATFYLIGYSTIKFGVTVSAIANKMSVVVPMLFSILYFGEKITVLKIVGFILAIIAIILAIYKKNTDKSDSKYFFLPVLLFIGIGSIDSIVKLMQNNYLTNQSIPVFTVTAFGCSGIIGTIILLLNTKLYVELKSVRNLTFGFLLGIANFGTMYFLIYALNYSNLDSSIVYAVNNIGILSFSILATVILFKEKISRINIAGIALAIIAICLLSIKF